MGFPKKRKNQCPFRRDTNGLKHSQKVHNPPRVLAIFFASRNNAIKTAPDKEGVI
jgi:hypothetical protein